MELQIDYTTGQIQLFKLIRFEYDKHEEKIKHIIKKSNFDINYQKDTLLFERIFNFQEFIKFE